MDKHDRFFCSIAEAKQLDPKYAQAKNEDFEAFSEEDYVFLREYIANRVKEEALNGKRDPYEAARERHREISKLIEVNPLYVRSKMRRWALTVLKTTADKFDEDLQKEKDLNEKILLLFRREPSKIKQTLTSIIHFLESYEDDIEGVNISTCMYRFGELIKRLEDRFYCDDEAKAFIEKIAQFLKTKVRYFDSQGLGAIMYSLLNLPDRCETRTIIDGISDSFESNIPKLDSQCVGMSLYALQNFHKSEETIRFLKIMGQALQRDKIKLELQSLNNAIFGLQNFIHLDEIKDIRQYLEEQLEMLDTCEISPTNLLSLVQAVRITGLEVPKQLADAYDVYTQKNGNTKFESRCEESAFKRLKKVFPQHEIVHNCYIDGFELDIFLPDLRLNIEIDGRFHKENCVREDKRDQHLIERHKITVLRISAELISNIDELTEKTFAIRGPM